MKCGIAVLFAFGLSVMGCFAPPSGSSSGSIGSSGTVGSSSSSGSGRGATGTSSSGGASGLAAVITWVSSTPLVISLAGSGGQTTSTVIFKVQTASGLPVGDGVQVSFSLSYAVGGASLSPLTAVTAGGSGMVQTVLSAGTLPGSVVVMAMTGTVSGQSTPITIEGNGINGQHLVLSCPHRSIGGLTAFGLQDICTVYAADVNGAFVPNTVISLLREAGSVPTTVAIQDSNTASAAFEYETACPYPVDVAPLPGEFAEDGGFFDRCLPTPAIVPRTVNPRDGRATLVAYVLGEQC